MHITRYTARGLTCLVASAVLLLGAASSVQAMTLGQIAIQVKDAPAGPFGSIEMVADHGANPVSQWNQAVAGMRRDAVNFANCLNDSEKCKGAAMTGWRDMVLGLQSANKTTQLRLVNTFFNRWQYREDKDTYGVSDRWASPSEFMANSGDCEDYAIAKYFTLSVLGFNDSDLRVMAVIDNSRAIGHSVLAAKVDGAVYVLDNLSASVQRDTDYAQSYTPRFAVNFSGVWTYSAKPVVANATPATPGDITTLASLEVASGE